MGSASTKRRLDLDALSEIAFQAIDDLCRGETLAWMHVYDFSGFKLADEGKHYLAKGTSQVDLTHYNERAGDVEKEFCPNLTVIAFDQGNGTGDRLPTSPRRKSGRAELMIPIGTVYGTRWIQGAVSLDETIPDTGAEHWDTITRVRLGLPGPAYRDALRGSMHRGKSSYHAITQAAWFTQDPLTGFGDDHAIVAPTLHHTNRDIIQIAAFLPLPSTNPQVLERARALTALRAVEHAYGCIRASE